MSGCDVIAYMGFRPQIAAGLKTMDARAFSRLSDGLGRRFTANRGATALNVSRSGVQCAAKRPAHEHPLESAV
jgi:hypothetical protein